MKKTKLVLLTVLLLLVLYCGAIIFVTKPSTFAFNAIFGGIDNTVRVATIQSVDAAPSMAEISAVADAAADKARVQAVEEAAQNADAAIKEAVSAIVIPEVPEVDTAAIADSVATAIEPSIVESVLSQVMAYEGTIAQNIYDTYSQSLIDAITAQVIAALQVQEPVAAVEEPVIEEAVVEELTEEPVVEDVVVEEPVVEDVVVEMTEDEYEEARQQVRESEIEDLLSQLQD